MRYLITKKGAINLNTKFTKNPIIKNKLAINEINPAGNLFEEINEQDMSLIAGGTNDAISGAIANAVGLGNNYGMACTWSAECNGTTPC